MRVPTHRDRRFRLIVLNPPDLQKIADLTLQYYNQCAEDFWEGTRDHDVS